jgi:exosortase/archaeosortase family protein
LQRRFEPGQSAERFISLDLGSAFAVAAVFSLLLSEARARPSISRADLAVVIAGALSWFLPESHAVYLGMTLAGAQLAMGRSRQSLPREIGHVWLALSLCQLWSKIAFKMFYQAIEPFEVDLMVWVGRLAYPDLRAIGANLNARPGWSIAMLEGCSAFHNLSLSALLWLCVLKIAGRQADRGALIALAVSASLVVAINISRILAMLPSPDAYHFWHDDAGSVAVALASAAAALVPAVVWVERSVGTGRSP